MLTAKVFPGTEAQYVALHDWVYRKLGRPQKCDECGTTEYHRYEWANISGKYKRDITDWRRLCVPCHRKLDRGDMCQSKRHEMTPENTYTYPNGKKNCKQCRRERQRIWKQRRREHERNQ